MPSPFPGIDPYLESQDLWPDFHVGFTATLCDAISEQLPDPYVARIDERMNLVDTVATIPGPWIMPPSPPEGSWSSRPGFGLVAPEPGPAPSHTSIARRRPQPGTSSSATSSGTDGSHGSTVFDVAPSNLSSRITSAFSRPGTYRFFSASRSRTNRRHRARGWANLANVVPVRHRRSNRR